MIYSNAPHIAYIGSDEIRVVYAPHIAYIGSDEIRVVYAPHIAYIQVHKGKTKQQKYNTNSHKNLELDEMFPDD
jgi:hypothetical protein